MLCYAMLCYAVQCAVCGVIVSNRRFVDSLPESEEGHISEGYVPTIHLQ